jgi:hypothetical protein
MVFHLSLRPRPLEMISIVLPAVVFWAAYVWLFRVSLHLVPNPVFIIGTLGAGSLVVLSTRAVWAEGEEKKRVLAVLFPAAGLLLFLMLKQAMLNLDTLQPGTYDLHLFLVDGSLGVQPAFIVSHFVRTHAAANLIITIAYASIAVAMAIVYSVHLHKCKSGYYMLQLFLAAGFLGWALYNVVPAAGPLYFLGPNIDGPLPTYAQLPYVVLERVNLPLSVFRNAMPSLHLGWALLLWWNSGKLGRATRWFAAAFVFFTALATLGTGEHYLIDLVVAFPFTLMVQALCTRRLPGSQIRLVTAAVGTVIMLSWMLVLRFDPKVFLVSRVLPWTCMILTVAVSQYLFRRLEKAADGVFWTAEKEAAEVTSEPVEEPAVG